jgi:hypothetical protein
LMQKMPLAFANVALVLSELNEKHRAFHAP